MSLLLDNLSGWLSKMLKFIKRYPFLSFIFITLLFLNIFVLVVAEKPRGWFVYDSLDMLQGRFSRNYIAVDTIVYNGKNFSNQLPLPAILFLPIAWLIGITGIFKIWLTGQAILLLIIVGSLWKLLQTKYKNVSQENRLWLMAAFLSSSIMFNIYSMPGYLSHPVALIFGLLGLFEYYTRKRLWLIGLYFGLVVLTRQSAALGILFFLLMELYKGNFKLNQKFIQNCAKLLIPVFIGILLFIGFNYIRFGQIGVPVDTAVISFVDRNPAKPIYVKDLGKYNQNFGLQYVPSNFYFMFLHPGYPIRDTSYQQAFDKEKDKDILERFTWDNIILKFPYISSKINAKYLEGVSILLGTPYLLYLFFCQYKNREDLFLLITILPILGLILLLPYNGALQFAYRYTLDFWPFLFLIFANQVSKKFTINLKVLVVLALLINAYFLFAQYGPY